MMLGVQMKMKIFFIMYLFFCLAEMKVKKFMFIQLLRPTNLELETCVRRPYRSRWIQNSSTLIIDAMELGKRCLAPGTRKLEFGIPRSNTKQHYVLNPTFNSYVTPIP